MTQPDPVQAVLEAIRPIVSMLVSTPSAVDKLKKAIENKEGCTFTADEALAFGLIISNSNKK